MHVLHQIQCERHLSHYLHVCDICQHLEYYNRKFEDRELSSVFGILNSTGRSYVDMNGHYQVTYSYLHVCDICKNEEYIENKKFEKLYE